MRHNGGTGGTYQSTRLRDVVGVWPIGIAALFALSYLLFAWSGWSRELDTHLLKMAVFTSTQLLFAASIAWAVWSLRKAPADQAGEPYENLKRLAPLFVFASIMMSAYYFGKELLAAFDEPQLRPIMMSVFLQLVGVCVFDVLCFGKSRAGPATAVS